MQQISPKFVRKAAAKSVILGQKNLKKVPRNPLGTANNPHPLDWLFDSLSWPSVAGVW